MKLGIVSDIHNNAAALQKAFALAPEVDYWVSLGDAINQYRFSNQVVALLRDHCRHAIHGNHEEVFFGALGVRARSADWIDQALLHWYSSQPARQPLQLLDKTILLVHSTPWQPTGAYVYPHSRDFSRFGTVADDVVLYGHTHQAVVKQLGSTLVINPGSTGQGQWTGTAFKHSFATYDAARHQAELIDFQLSSNSPA